MSTKEYSDNQNIEVNKQLAKELARTILEIERREVNSLNPRPANQVVSEIIRVIEEAIKC